MAFESDSLNRRSLGPVVASAAVGIALGIVAVIGANVFSDRDTLPASGAVTVDSSLLGDPQYGSRN